MMKIYEEREMRSRQADSRADYEWLRTELEITNNMWLQYRV